MNSHTLSSTEFGQFRACQCPLANIPRPQSVRSNLDRIVQAVRNLVEVFIEQVCVDVESHRRLRVSQHPLHGFDFGPHADGEAGCGVAEIVRLRAVVRAESSARTTAQTTEAS